MVLNRKWSGVNWEEGILSKKKRKTSVKHGYGVIKDRQRTATRV